MGVLVTEKGLNRKTPYPQTTGGAAASNRTPSPSGMDIPITSGIYPNLNEPAPSAPPEPSEYSSTSYQHGRYRGSNPPTYDSLYN